MLWRFLLLYFCFFENIFGSTNICQIFWRFLCKTRAPKPYYYSPRGTEWPEIIMTNDLNLAYKQYANQHIDTFITNRKTTETFFVSLLSYFTNDPSIQCFLDPSNCGVNISFIRQMKLLLTKQ